jgi:DNA-binding NtrC family response regulator
LCALEEFPWPGNVRELRNLMERIVIMNPQPRIGARHILLDRTRRAGFDRRRHAGPGALASVPQDEGSGNRREGMTEFCYSREDFF